LEITLLLPKLLKMKTINYKKKIFFEYLNYWVKGASKNTYTRNWTYNMFLVSFYWAQPPPAMIACTHLYMFNMLEQWSSTWGTQRHLTEPVEPWTISDPSAHKDSSPNWGAGLPQTSSIISLTGQNHINNWLLIFMILLFNTLFWM
jgi:hypothetical protein